MGPIGFPLTAIVRIPGSTVTVTITISSFHISAKKKFAFACSQPCDTLITSPSLEIYTLSFWTYPHPCVIPLVILSLLYLTFISISHTTGADGGSSFTNVEGFLYEGSSTSL
ncbi:hypothetical protein BGW80DRAFT_864824 [Lactifluus volemus]|nr:hypothetical protein BGW80DRAFT_864824 [Lactifluus volemus]